MCDCKELKLGKPLGGIGYLCTHNSLQVKYPDLCRQWHPDNTLSPSDVTHSSHKVVKWICSINPRHIWNASINSRTGPNKSGCSYCAGRDVLPEESLAHYFPELANQWHPTLNKKGPETYTFSSHAMACWICPKNPKHIWNASINSRTNKGQGTNCPYCAGKRVLPEESLLAFYPEIAAQWHGPSNAQGPNTYTPYSNVSVYWICPYDLNHIYSMPIYHRTLDGRGCSYCAGKLVCPNKSLAYLYPHLINEWHPMLNLEGPDKFTAHSGKDAFWICLNNQDHVYKAKINDRTRRDKPTGCPKCRQSHGERAIQNYLTNK